MRGREVAVVGAKGGAAALQALGMARPEAHAPYCSFARAQTHLLSICRAAKQPLASPQQGR